MDSDERKKTAILGIFLDVGLSESGGEAGEEGEFGAYGDEGVD